MTIEERAQKAVEKFCEDEAELRGPDKKKPVSFVAYSSKLRQRISEALRDQIEDCAKTAGQAPLNKYEIEKAIRALAEPTEERKETER